MCKVRLKLPSLLPTWPCLVFVLTCQLYVNEMLDKKLKALEQKIKRILCAISFEKVGYFFIFPLYYYYNKPLNPHL